jgi:hypothetical protein
MLKILGIIKKHLIYVLNKKLFTKHKLDFGSFYIQNPYITLDSIKQAINNKITGVYLRFGDGDVNLMEGKDDLLQKNNKLLSIEMSEAFSLSGPGIFKCLPIHSKKYGVMPFMCPGIHEGDNKWVENILKRTSRFFIGNLIYSPVALSYITAYDTDYAIEFYKFIKKQNLIFVGNESIDEKVLNKLFGKILHIKTPENNSFYEINRIENELSKYLESNNKYTVVIIAMGCSGRILEKRIINKKFNCFMFDFGSTIDIFCNKKTRAWMDIDENIKKDHFINLLEKI